MNKGDYIFVGTKGICKIEDIKKNAFVGCDKTKEYYVLKPYNSCANMVVFLPTDTTLKTRLLITKEKAKEALFFIKNINKIDDNYELDVDSILKEVDFDKRINTMKYLINKKKNVSKKQFSLQEQKTLDTLVGCVVDEISCVLGCSSSEIRELLV